MKNLILATDNNLFGFFSRLAVGLIMFPHGAQKALGWFGGAGFNGTLHAFSAYFHLPTAIGVLVILVEFGGSLALIAGFTTRLWSAAMMILVIGMVVEGSWQHGFFMNWQGQQSGEGIEYHILLFALLLISFVSGGGRWSLDRALLKKDLQSEKQTFTVANARAFKNFFY